MCIYRCGHSLKSHETWSIKLSLKANEFILRGWISHWAVTCQSCPGACTAVAEVYIGTRSQSHFSVWREHQLRAGDCWTNIYPRVSSHTKQPRRVENTHASLYNIILLRERDSQVTPRPLLLCRRAGGRTCSSWGSCRPRQNRWNPAVVFFCRALSHSLIGASNSVS